MVLVTARQRGPVRGEGDGGRRVRVAALDGGEQIAAVGVPELDLAVLAAARQEFAAGRKSQPRHRGLVATVHLGNAAGDTPDHDRAVARAGRQASPVGGPGDATDPRRQRRDGDLLERGAAPELYAAVPADARQPLAV